MRFATQTPTIFALAPLLLASCGGDPTVDASSDEALEASLEEISASLDPESREEFESSVQALIFAGLDGKGFLEMSADLESGGMERRFKDVLDGKTAAEIIAEGKSVTARRAERKRRAATDELSSLEEKLDGDAQARALLGGFKVHQSRFIQSSSDFSTQRVIELSVTNATDHAVARAYFDGTLATPGREVPWVEASFNYSIPGGIEPGESATWNLRPNMFGEWSQAPSDREDMVLTVEVVELDGADGESLFPKRFTKEDLEDTKLAIEDAGGAIGERVSGKLADWKRQRLERLTAEQERQAALEAETAAAAAREAAAERAAEAEAARKEAENAAAEEAAKVAEAARKASYIAEHVKLYDVEASYRETFANGRVPGVLFKLKNTGTETLDRVVVTVYFHDQSGATIAEEDFVPIRSSAFSISGNNGPLKPGYVWQMEKGLFYGAESVPSEWDEGSFEAKVTDIEFATEK